MRRKTKNYVSRPSQITKGPPSRRLRKRRKRNVKAPKKGFFPNPVKMYKICIRRGKGPLMHYDGEKFSQRARVKLFKTSDEAVTRAKALMKQFPVLRPYRVTVESNF